MRTHNTLLKLSFAAAASLAAFASAAAQSVWTSGHGDIGIELHGDHFHTHWGIDALSVVDGTTLTGSEEYRPEDIVAKIDSTLPAVASVAAALGIQAGDTVFRAGNNTYQPNLGFSAYGIGLENNWLAVDGFSQAGGLTIELTGWNAGNPGEFVLARSNGTALFSTLSTGVPNSLFILAGDHEHYSWFFSTAGYYELSLTWSGTHAEYGFISITDTYGFQVGNAIPEPSTWAAILGGITAIGTVARRRAKRS